MADGFLTAVIGLVSAILGGLIQSLASGRLEKFRFDQKAKWDLYSAYFVTLGNLSFAKAESAEHVSALSNMAQIRGRIAVYGSSEVVRAVGEVFRHANLNTEDAQSAMAKALDAMRRDVGRASGKISRSEIVQMMFGSSRG